VLEAKEKELVRHGKELMALQNSIIMQREQAFQAVTETESVDIDVLVRACEEKLGLQYGAHTRQAGISEDTSRTRGEVRANNTAKHAKNVRPDSAAALAKPQDIAPKQSTKPSRGNSSGTKTANVDQELRALTGVLQSERDAYFERLLRLEKVLSAVSGALPPSFVREMESALYGDP
jgi:hypothetical protein